MAKDLDNVLAIHYTVQCGRTQNNKVALFNKSVISEEDALDVIQRDEYSDDVLMMTQAQYLNVFFKEEDRVSFICNELCPYCDTEVTLLNKFEIQKCPNCGKYIKPCSICEHDNAKCSKCPLNVIDGFVSFDEKSGQGRWKLSDEKPQSQLSDELICYGCREMYGNEAPCETCLRKES